MAKSMTKVQLVDHLAKQAGLTKKDTARVLDELAAVAYKQAKTGFTIPGIGKLVVQKRKARKARSPATGEVIRVPAKRVVKFRVSKTAQDAIAPPKNK
jgi:DNA-binding protein HU-beta